MNVTSHTPDDGHETSTKPTFGKDVSADCTDSAEACDDSGGVENADPTDVPSISASVSVNSPLVTYDAGVSDTR